jgi:arginyl-tRNA synthetase
LKPSVDNIIESTSVAGPYLNIKVNKNAFTEKFLNFIENNKSGQTHRFAPTEKKSIYIDYI